MGQYHLQIAELLVRVFAGILFMSQGYDKLFKVKMSGVVDAFKSEARQKHIPEFLLRLLAYYTSCAELFGGLLLILGLAVNSALYALGLDLVLVCAAFSIMEPMWNMKHVYPRLVLVVTLLLFPHEYRLFALNYFLK